MSAARSSLRGVVVAATLVLALAGCGGGPCDGQAGTCLTVTVRGDVGTVDTLQFDLPAPIDKRFTKPMPMGTSRLPVQVGVLLPDVTAKVEVRVVALLGGAPVGLGKAVADLVPGARVSAEAVLAPTAGASCGNGFRDGAETDTDCGGTCAACLVGQRCLMQMDCGANFCDGMRCVAAACGDNVKNGKETDVDCGGGACPGCGGDKACEAGTDCMSGSCVAKTCVDASCSDGVKNQGEVDLDCGGPCTPCPAGSICAQPADCISGKCMNAVCGKLDLAFDAPFVYSAGAPQGVHSGDFNRDKKPDLITYSNGQFLVLLNRGGGLYAPPAGVAFPNARAFDQGDFNGDGNADLAIITNNAATVSFLSGRADGTFAAPMLPAVGGFMIDGPPVAIVTGEFSGDSRLDVVVLVPSKEQVQIYKGNGMGAFDALAPARLGPFPGALGLAAGDWNGDGRTDLAVSATVTNNMMVTTHVVHPIRHAAMGQLLVEPTITAGDRSNVLAVGDLNGDKRADLVAGSDSASSFVTLLGSAGPALLVPAASTNAPAPTRGISAADLTGDGKLDLLSSSTTASRVILFPGMGDGRFTVASVSDIAPPSSAILGAPVVADLSGDGNLDVALAAGAFIDVYLLPGKPTIASFRGIDIGDRGPRYFAAQDLNNDKSVDLIVTAQRGVFVLLALRGGFAQPMLTSTTGTPTGLVVRDLDGDGKIDVAVTTSNQVQVLRGMGNGQFQPLMNFAVGGSPVDLTSGDFNNDRRVDLATANAQSNDVSVLLGNGAPTLFDASKNLAAGGNRPQSITGGDLNGDGLSDIAVALQGSNAIAVLASMGGSGTFKAPEIIAVGNGPIAVTAADLNRDGKLDLVTANQTNVSVLIASANTFLAPVNYVAGSSLSSLSVADFNADGRPDLAVGTTNGAAIAVLLNKADMAATLDAPVSVFAGLAPYVNAGDINRDGKVDILAGTSPGGLQGTQVFILTNTGL